MELGRLGPMMMSAVAGAGWGRSMELGRLGPMMMSAVAGAARYGVAG